MSIPELSVADVSLAFCPTWSTTYSFVPDPKGQTRASTKTASTSIDFEYKILPWLGQDSRIDIIAKASGALRHSLQPLPDPEIS